jgi:hypothetical protein
VDVFNCITQGEILLNEPAEILSEVYYNDLICYGDSTLYTLFITGGSGNYEVQWSPLVSDYIHAGIYNVLIVDDYTCQKVLELNIEQPDRIQAEPTFANVCYSQYAEADLLVENAVGEYSINWYGANPYELSAGNYPISITDENLCTIDTIFMVLEWPQMQVVSDVGYDEVSNQGSILLDVSGGNPPYSFLWSNGTTENPILNLGGGLFSCVITDNSNCTFLVSNIEMINASIHDNSSQIYVSPIYGTNEIEVKGAGPLNVCVYDSSGRWVAKCGGISPLIIDTQKWENGMYIIKCNNSVSKIIKSI